MFPIREGATHKVVIGPVVAVGDGFTPVTTLALSTADEAEAILHDNGTVVDISAYTFAAITTADGYYHLTLQSGISNTMGHMTVVINDDSLCLPVRADFMVIASEIYDALYASDADGWNASGQVALLTATQASIDAIETDTNSLNDTKVPQTLNLTASGNIGIDWANVENPTTALDLSGTDIQLVDTVTTYTGNTVQTGDSFARIGAAGAGLTDLGGMSTTMKAQVNTETDSGWTTQMADSVATDGTIATREQALYLLVQMLTEFSITSTTLTVKKVDGSTSLATFTLDSATTPTSLTRAT